MTNEQKQIVLGTLLGNGFLCTGTNPYLCIQHSVHYRDYMLSKIKHLNEFGRKKAFYEKGNTLGWRSSCHPLWHDWNNFCYKNSKKTVTMEWLDQLQAIGMAIWYMDSGQLVGYKKRNACLRTQSYGIEGNEIIWSYFSQIGIPCSMNKSKKSWIIVFGAQETEKFLKIVAQFVHKSLYSKLLERE